MKEIPRLPLRLTPECLLGELVCEDADAPIPGAAWYTAQTAGQDGLLYRFPAGALAGARYLSADMLLDGRYLVVFKLTLQEGEDGSVFELLFGLLNQCSARMRVPLEAVDQGRWRYDREGAWLKPVCYGARVDLGRVDRAILWVERKRTQDARAHPARWCMTPLAVTADEPPRLVQPLLPQGPLLDELGQSTLHEWPAKSRSAEEVTARLHAQLESASAQRWPGDFSRWGGWREKRFEYAGFFRVRQEGGRWWLVDPDGHAFWSTGLDCVRVDTGAAYTDLESALTWLPDADGPYREIYAEREGGSRTVNYLAANFIRAFGPEMWREKWATIALAELRRLGFNTVANWSDWRVASQAGMPYVRPLGQEHLLLPRVYRDFPDVFHPDFEGVAAQFAEPLRETAGDPALIGYFLMNEPTWGFAGETPAKGMLFNTPACATRRALADFLRDRYGKDAAFSAAWGMDVRFAQVAEGVWKALLSPAAEADLADFSAVMVERFFGTLSAACRRVDPHHLNLGSRYYTVPPSWALGGMRHFDVFSMNCYRDRLPADEMSCVNTLLDLPILVGEWHFGALDVGLPGSGVGHVRDQAERGKAYRVYLEDAAAKPWCVGVHYFTLYDESALGRDDGENWNIGFLDVCNHPYEPLCEAARASHERLYGVAGGDLAPYADEPEYLPKLFL